MQQFRYTSNARNRRGDHEERTPLLWGQPNALANSAQTLNSNQFQQYYSSVGGGAGGNFSRPGTPSQQQQQQQSFQQQPAPSSRPIQTDGDLGKDPHSQFCALVGVPASDQPPELKIKKLRLNDKSLYGRASAQKRTQAATYAFTAALTNTLLLTQIILGAALTGLGGFPVPGYVITFVGALNTVIAGLVAYLKSRGQPLRARMFRDDLERVVDEIENSEVMWLGIAKGVHGYDDIDTAEVTVRSEVARLTRLYDKAVRNNTANNPELYSGGASGGAPGAGSEGTGANRGGGATQFLTLPALESLPPVQNGDASGDGGNDSAGTGTAPANPAPAAQKDDADQAPASAPTKKKDDDKPKPDSDPASDTKKPAAPSSDTKPAADKKPDTTTATSPATDTAKKPSTPAPAPASDADKGKSTPAPSAAKPTPVPAPKPVDPDASPATMLTSRKKSSPEIPKKDGGST